MSVTDFVAGWMGGISVLLVGHPFDTVKVWQQSTAISRVGQRPITNSLHAAMEVYRLDGIRAFYKGVAAPMCAVGFANGALFCTYSFIVHSLIQQETQMYVEGLDDEVYMSYASQKDEEGRFPKQDLSEHFRTGGGLTAFENFIAATGGGIAHATIMNPFEVVKIRMQTERLFSHRRYLGTVHCARRLAASGGAKSFFKGYGATLIRDIPGTGVYLASYSLAIRLIGGEKNYSIPLILLAGGFAGMAQWVVVFPLDTIKTKIQVTKTNEGIDWARCARSLYQRRGLLGFYRGIFPALVRAFAANGAAFVGVEATLKFFRGGDMEDPVL